MGSTISWFNDFVVATEKDTKLSWSGSPANFRCGFCGHKFKAGDEFRAIFTNDTRAGGNPFICRECYVEHDGFDGARLEWKRKTEEFRAGKNGPMWWFLRDRS